VIKYHQPTVYTSLIFTGCVVTVGLSLFFLTICCIFAGLYLGIAHLFGIAV
jgi:hypothetical protein